MLINFYKKSLKMYFFVVCVGLVCKTQKNKKNFSLPFIKNEKNYMMI